MGHQDFSQICPIFKEGVEHELEIPYTMGSCTVCTMPTFMHQFGREVVVHEIFGKIYHSTTCFACVSTSGSIGIYKRTGNASTACDMTLATLIGALGFGSVDCSLTGDCKISASLASTSFGSLDTLLLTNLTFMELGRTNTAGSWPKIVIRYRDK